MLAYQHKAMEEESCDKVDDEDVKPKAEWSLDHNDKIINCTGAIAIQILLMACSSSV